MIQKVYITHTTTKKQICFRRNKIKFCYSKKLGHNMKVLFLFCKMSYICGTKKLVQCLYKDRHVESTLYSTAIEMKFMSQFDVDFQFV